jgi:hypothetical protein
MEICKQILWLSPPGWLAVPSPLPGKILGFTAWQLTAKLLLGLSSRAIISSVFYSLTALGAFRIFM